MRTSLLTLACLPFLSMSQQSCGGDPDSAYASALSHAARVELSEELPARESSSDGDERAFHRQLKGAWHVTTFVEGPDGTGAWVDLYWIMGHNYGLHVVTLYGDPDLSVPLLRWDLIRGYELEQPSTLFPAAYDLRWSDVGSWLTPYVDSPDLMSSLGVDDCDLAVGVRVDTSDNCGAPLFPFRQCDLLDFAQVLDDTLTFGDPQSTDRCVERANRYEAWSFERVEITPELIQDLIGRTHP